MLECKRITNHFNYGEWRNFLKVIEKAEIACESSGTNVSYHFVDINKMIELAKGAQREIEDVALTRYACYLVAQNGDSSKSEVAFAQTYFA
ncbi:MAG TPA: DNA damage-inducible protein D, partial [Chitinophagaceae bacterium]